MKDFFLNFLTTFVGAFVGGYVVKHFVFPGSGNGLPDWAYCLIGAFALGLFNAFRERKKEEDGDE